LSAAVVAVAHAQLVAAAVAVLQRQMVTQSHQGKSLPLLLAQAVWEHQIHLHRMALTAHRLVSCESQTRSVSPLMAVAAEKTTCPPVSVLVVHPEQQAGQVRLHPTQEVPN
jgi:hypothetical protein